MIYCGSRDQVLLQKDSKGNYLSYFSSTKNTDVRDATIEDIIAALRRMRKENYTIYITGVSFDNARYLNNPTDELCKRLKSKTSNDIKLSMVDDSLIFYNVDENNRKKQELNHKLLTDLYRIANGKKFKEYIGIYKDKTVEGVSDANKNEKKILTFALALAATGNSYNVDITIEKVD